MGSVMKFSLRKEKKKKKREKKSQTQMKERQSSCSKELAMMNGDLLLERLLWTPIRGERSWVAVKPFFRFLPSSFLSSFFLPSSASSLLISSPLPLETGPFSPVLLLLCALSTPRGTPNSVSIEGNSALVFPSSFHMEAVIEAVIEAVNQFHDLGKLITLDFTLVDNLLSPVNEVVPLPAAYFRILVR